MRRVIAALTALTSLIGGIAPAACVSGDVDEEKATETVPADITPEDATFRYTAQENGTKLVLEIHLSKVPLCKRDVVPVGNQFVQLEVVSPDGSEIGPGTYPLKQEQHTRIRLLRMTAPSCASSAGSVASSGFVQLDEVTEDVVRGSFVGTNPDSKIDLRSSFVATHCGPGVDCL